MPSGVLTIEQLEEVVEAYSEFDEFCVDVETLGPHRGNPHQNDVFWISLAGPGRADAIPCGHPLGERVVRDPNDDFYRIDKQGHHQEHRLNETTGRLKWVTVPEPFEEPPKQLWISDIADALRPLFFSDRRKIGQNVKFDLLSMAKYFGDIPPPPYADTLVAAKLINENWYTYDLGSLVKREFDYEYDKIGKKGPDKFPYSEAHLYSYLDAKYTWLLWIEYQKQLDREGVRQVFDLEMDLLPVICDMEYTGVPIDEAELAKLGEEFQMEMARLKIDIDDVWMAEGRHDEPINLNANKQVAELVYDILGKPCHERTKTGQRSTKADVLQAFEKNSTVAKILDYAKLNKLQGTFIEGITDKLVDGRVHPSFNQAGSGDRGQGAGGAVSGRLSCSSPNIQQIPSRSERGKRVRDVFIASPGHKLVVADLSQIELRMLAHFTQDKTLLKAYRDNIDLHSLLAARVFGEDFTPIERSLAKNGNFSVLFGAQARTLVRRYGFPSLRLAEQVLEGFYDTYTAVAPWKEEILAQARAKRNKSKKVECYVETILGRKRRLPALRYLDRGQRQAAERQAISVTISGSAADLFKVIMMDCFDLLEAQEWEAHILMVVHDELVVEVPAEYADDGLALVKSAMEDVVHPFTGEPILTVPIVADAKVVDRWSDGH